MSCVVILQYTVQCKGNHRFAIHPDKLILHASSHYSGTPWWNPCGKKRNLKLMQGLSQKGGVVLFSVVYFYGAVCEEFISHDG